MCDLYERIEELCNSKGVSGYRMCKDIGISPSTITELRKGRQSSINADKTAKISAYFGISTDELLGIKKQPTSEEDELEEYLEMLRTRPECRMLLDTVKGAKKSEVEENVRFIEALRAAKND